MAAGYQLTAGQMAAIRETVRRVMMQHRGETVQAPRSQVQRNVQVILKSHLLAAVDCQTDPSTAQAYVMRKNSAGDLEATDREITIVNRFQEISVDAGTYAKAEWIDGEWQLYAADCAVDASFGPSDLVSE